MYTCIDVHVQCSCTCIGVLVLILVLMYLCLYIDNYTDVLVYSIYMYI